MTLTTLAASARPTTVDLVPVPRGDYPALRSAFGRFPTGVAALCAEVNGERVGMVASSFTVGASFEPPMVMFAAQDSSTTWPRLRTASRIGVSVLGSTHDEACMRLSSRSRDRFEDLDVHDARSGALFVHDSALWLECVVRGETPAGDHHVVLLEVVALRHADLEPLIYHGAEFRTLSAKEQLNP
jgi:flavin reductase (DIM6/NTAB) family NADH-FMN oxidoreductase RutF